MEADDPYESAWFQIKVREVLCTIIILRNTIEIKTLMGQDNPFNIGRRSEFDAVKKLYRGIYKPKDMTVEQVNEAVARALAIYNEEFGP